MLLVQPLFVVPPRGVLPRLAVVFYRVIPVTTFRHRYDFGMKKYDFHIKKPFANCKGLVNPVRTVLYCL